jgi:hypothetical protein
MDKPLHSDQPRAPRLVWAPPRVTDLPPLRRLTLETHGEDLGDGFGGSGGSGGLTF